MLYDIDDEDNNLYGSDGTLDQFDDFTNVEDLFNSNNSDEDDEDSF